MARGIAAVLIVICFLVSPHDGAYAKFVEAYGTFNNAPLAIDGNSSTFAEATGNPYRDEYFLIVRFESPSIVRNLKVRFQGPAPKDYILEMGPDALAWKPYDVGEKAKYVRVRFAANKGDVYKIAEVEANSEIAPKEAFIPYRLSITDFDTTSATLTVSFPKPFRMSVSYGLENREDALSNFTEYTSYLTDYQVRLRNLIEGMDYYINVKAISAEGEVWLSTDSTGLLHVRLLGTPPLKILNFGVVEVSPLSISLAVQTNIPAHCIFYFGEGTRLDQIMSQPGFDTRHVFEFKSLYPNRLYSYMAHLTDHRGLNVTMAKTQITTAEMNIAKGKRVIAGTFTNLREPGWQGGSDNQGETVLQRITDGKNDYFSGMAHSGDLVFQDQYAVVDLGRVYTLDAHAVAWRTLAYPHSYEIFLSLDNKEWTRAFTLSPGRMEMGANIRSNSGDPLIVVGGPFEEGTKARYVKLFIPKGTDFYRKHRRWNNVDLAELVVYPGGDYAEIQKIIREEWRP